jgi:hypothetical protein
MKKWHKILALAIFTALVILAGCSEDTYTQSIKITIEPINITGRIAKIEYYRDRELSNSIKLIDGDGDSIIDGKSGPSVEGNWPKGWEWFDDMHNDVIVGYSTIIMVEGKIRIRNGTTYEFMPGEYECENIR